MGSHGMTIALPNHHHDNSDSSSSSTMAQALLTISSITADSPALGLTHKDKGSVASSRSFNGTLLSLRAPPAAAASGAGGGAGGKISSGASAGASGDEKGGGVLIEGVVGDVTVFQVTNDGLMHILL